MRSMDQSYQNVFIPFKNIERRVRPLVIKRNAWLIRLFWLSDKTQFRKPEHEVKENISPLPVQMISITKAIDKNIHKICEYNGSSPIKLNLLHILFIVKSRDQMPPLWR